jgi:exosortase/archaeosortase family protein
VNTKKEKKSGSPKKSAKSDLSGSSTTVPHAKPKKPLFSKELLIKLLPLIKAFALWFILVAIVHIPGIKQDFRDLIVGFTTWSTVLIGKILFLPVARLGFSTFDVDGFTMEIIVECTAYNFYFFAIALTVFANWSRNRKLINLLIFFLVIFLTNTLRFYAMGYVGRHYPEFFDTTHDYVWNILFGFMIFGVWAWRDSKDNPDFKPKEGQP